MEVRQKMLVTLNEWYARNILKLIVYRNSAYLVPFIPDEVREYIPFRIFHLRILTRKKFSSKFPPNYLSREALQTIVLSAGHFFTDDSTMVIEDFGTFRTAPDISMQFDAAERFCRAVANRELIEEPGLESVPWQEIFGNSQTITHEHIGMVMAHAFADNFFVDSDGKIILRAEDCAKIPELVYVSFFSSIINGLVLGKRVLVDGFGTFSYNTESEKIEFDADKRISKAAELFYLRQKPLPYYPKVTTITVERQDKNKK